MERPSCCMDCCALLNGQRFTPHRQLVVKNQITGYVIYKCRSCHSVLELGEQPSQWHKLAKEPLFTS